MAGDRAFTTGKTHVLHLVKLAGERCVEVEGTHFDFDKVFIRPDGIAALELAHHLLDQDPNRRALIFGHTDTIGTEEYNKGLSERRARIVLAALLHDAAPWEATYEQEQWGLRSVQIMLNAVLGPDDGAELPLDEDGKDGPKTKAAVKAFQARADHPPLGIDGVAGPLTRHELILAYMKLASKTPQTPARFHDFGAEKHMGCSEFNPFSVAGRDEASRRVCVMVVDPGARPKNLPCVVGDLGPCRANLLADGETPVDGADSPQMAHFKCKIYRQLSRKCEGADPHDDGSAAGWLAPALVLPRPGRTIFDPLTGTLDLFITKVKDTTSRDEAYLLEARDGSFSQTRKRSEAQPFDAGALFVRFTGVLPDRSYSFFKVFGPTRLVFFEDVPIDRVNGDGNAPAPPRPALVASRSAESDAKIDSRPGDPKGSADDDLLALV